MVCQTNRKQVDSASAARYRDVARALLGGAETLSTLAEAGDSFGSPMALLAVHAAIAYADVLTIAYGGVKSTDGDHAAVVLTLKDVLRHRTAESALKHLRAVINEKDTIAYQGESYSLDDGQAVLHRAQLFCRWAEDLYQRRS